ncbi:MAG: ExbD/TolR family protein [Candidatus Methylacidiphilales bacterium]
MIAKRRAVEDVSFQLAPMIDMTFLLLIFFMVTTKITKEKKKLDIALPVAAAAVTPDDLSGREIINLDADGVFYIGDTPVDEKKLKAYMRQRLIDFPPLRIYVRADANTPAKEIKRFMKICAESGAIEVIFGSYKK